VRVRGFVWTVERWLRRLVVGFPLVTACQVAAVRVVDPPFTLTMVQRAVEHARATGSVAWPAYEPRPLAELGEDVPRAFVASEDGRFFLHGGFDFDGICHAVAENADGGRLHGGSSITQQVAKNVFLWQGRSWLRKGLEVWYTVLLEALLPKERILELYLDVAETGPMTFGAEAGARRAFGRPAKSLSLEEAGRLAGILPDPRNRAVTGSAARERAAFVLANPAPFPDDPWFDLAVKSWRSTWHGPWQCL
jgi:monofunctional biosynthetic peptidoglycan transglycosylase